MRKKIFCRVIIAAGGMGKRFGAPLPKQFYEICGRRILDYTLSTINGCEAVDEILVSSPADYLGITENISEQYNKVRAVYEGGATRQETVYKGLLMCDGEGVTLIHDGARPFVSAKDITGVYEAACLKRAAVLAVPPKDAIHAFLGGTSSLTSIGKHNCYLAQTPQGFETKIIKQAYIKAMNEGINAEDECALANMLGITPCFVMGSYENIKITDANDLIFAEAYIRKMNNHL